MEIYDTLTMLEGMKEQKPVRSFLKDHFFPTSPQDIFTSEKVMVDYDDESSEKLAPAVVAGAINVKRGGFTSKEYVAPLVSVKRVLTASQLGKRVFNEAMFDGMTPEQREAQYLANDITDLTKMIVRTEEYMCGKLLTENAFTLKQYINGYDQVGQDFTIDFFGAGQTANQAVFSPANLWDTASADPLADIATMCENLKKRGLPADTVIFGAGAASAFLKNEDIVKSLDNRRIFIAEEVRPDALENGATFIGRFNAYGHVVDIYSYTAQYTDEAGKSVYYIPAKAAIVTAENIGRTAYGAITQYEEGSTDPSTYAAARVPHITVNRNDSIKEIAVQSRPLPMPKHINPFYRADVTA